MRSRGGIPSTFPMVAALVAVFMTTPLDKGVTGQYLSRCYRSVPQGRHKVHSNCNAANAGLIGLLALAAASSSFGQVRTRAPAGNELAQYCAPHHESTDAPKFYCRSEV